MSEQFLYQGRWVRKEHFRAFVYNGKSKKLAKSYDEYKNLVDSGLWFPSGDVAEVKPINIRKNRKPKDVPNS